MDIKPAGLNQPGKTVVYEKALGLGLIKIKLKAKTEGLVGIYLVNGIKSTALNRIAKNSIRVIKIQSFKEHR